jgi:hypothetical protein
MEIRPRSAWGAAAPKSRTPWNPDALLGATVHYFGIPDAVPDPDMVAAQLRGVQRGHMAPGGLGAKDGGADIAYNFIVDPWGRIWEGRGWFTQTGANGTTFANRNYIAYVYAAGVGDPFTVAARAAMAWLVKEGWRRGIGREVKPHAFWTGSACPGRVVKEWIAAKGWTTAPAPANGKEDEMYPWLMDWIEWRLFGRLRGEPRPDGVPTRIPEDAWVAATAVAAMVKLQGSHPAYQDWRDWAYVYARETPRPENVPARIPPEWWSASARDLDALREFAKRALAAAPSPEQVEALKAQLAQAQAQLAECVAKDGGATPEEEARVRELLNAALEVLS